MRRVGVSIVSTGESERLESCLASLNTQRFDGSIAVSVIVNGPDERTEDVARASPMDVTLIRRARRFGFAENHNAGLATLDCDFGLVLNPDVVLEQECVHEFVMAMDRHAGAGMVVPALRYPSGAPQPSARRFPGLMGTIVRRTPLRALAGDRVMRSAHYLPPPTDDRQVDWALGACLFVRAEAWRELGGFDAGVRPLYVEDIDIAWRMWQAGWEIWQTPAARAVHEHQAATDRIFFDRRTLWHMRGMLRFVRKHPASLFAARHVG